MLAAMPARVVDAPKLRMVKTVIICFQERALIPCLPPCPAEVPHSNGPTLRAHVSLTIRSATSPDVAPSLFRQPCAVPPRSRQQRIERPFPTLGRSSAGLLERHSSNHALAAHSEPSGFHGHSARDGRRTR